jgi:hypothetical protein
LKDYLGSGNTCSVSIAAVVVVEACAHASRSAWRERARSGASGGREESNDGGELHFDNVLDLFFVLKSLKSFELSVVDVVVE